MIEEEKCIPISEKANMIQREQGTYLVFICLKRVSAQSIGPNAFL